MAADVEIPQPVTSGALDHPNAPQSGTSEGAWQDYKPAAKAQEGQWQDYKTPAAAPVTGVTPKPAAPAPPSSMQQDQDTISKGVDVAKRYGTRLGQSLVCPRTRKN